VVRKVWNEDRTSALGGSSKTDRDNPCTPSSYFSKKVDPQASKEQPQSNDWGNCKEEEDVYQETEEVSQKSKAVEQTEGFVSLPSNHPYRGSYCGSSRSYSSSPTASPLQ